ncbi:hypothetical protein ACP70R_034198 [Stipagrostis hirtigluma subsp. patula]
MSTRPKPETMPPSRSPSPPSSDRRHAAIQELRRGTQLAALLRQQVELIPELDRRDAAVANVSEISMAMESSLSILQSESEQSSSSEAGAVAMAALASYYSSGGTGSRNGAVSRARKVRHRRGKHGEELPIWKCKEVATEAPENDPFHWRKYGEKKILNAEHPRLYYKCGYSDDHRCPARKYVQQQNNSDPPVYVVTFIDEHTCTALFPDQHSSSSGASQVLDFTQVSLSPPLMPGVPGLKKEEEPSTSMAMPTYAYDESSPSLPSLSPNGDQIDFSPNFGW